jgi:hypothetical protein
MVKDGKCANCGADAFTISRLAEVYKVAHTDPRKKDAGLCEFHQLTLTHADTKGARTFEFSICPGGCGTKLAKFEHVESKLLPKWVCPNGCF